MQKTILSLVLLLTFGTAQASNWESIGATSNGVEHFIDASSVRVSGNTRRAWHKAVYPPRNTQGQGPNADKWVSFSLEYRAFNCAEGTSRGESLTIYFTDDSNHVVNPTSFPDPWQPVPPDTVLEEAMNYVCARKPN